MDQVKSLSNALKSINRIDKQDNTALNLSRAIVSLVITLNVEKEVYKALKKRLEN